jgi:hypothetical protein
MKLGFLLKDIGYNQLAHDLIQSINTTLKNKACPHQITIFTENVEEMIKTPSCPVMSASELWTYDGNVVATSMATAVKLLKAIGPKKKCLYVHAPEWFSQSQIMQYENTHAIYMHPELDILTRNAEYNELFTSCFNKEPKSIWDNFDINKLAGILE